MDLHQLRCFVAVAEELHFGRAARRLNMLPSAIGRHIRLLEDDLSTGLFARTTRNVALTEDGATMLQEARALLASADEISKRFRERGRRRAKTLKVGAVDTAAAGLMPMLLHDFRARAVGIVGVDLPLAVATRLHRTDGLAAGRQRSRPQDFPGRCDISDLEADVIQNTPAIGIRQMSRIVEHELKVFVAVRHLEIHPAQRLVVRTATPDLLESEQPDIELQRRLQIGDHEADVPDARGNARGGQIHAPVFDGP